MQLISLVKKRNADQDLTGAEKASLNELLEQAARKSRFEIEIGCGNGHFLAAYTSARPEIFFAGIELKKERSLKIQKKILQRQLVNAAVIDGPAERAVHHLPAGSVDRYHIYFPDPWPKNKHRKRRFFRWPNLEALCRSLKQGGKIYFASDISDYCLQARVLMLLHPQLGCLEDPPPEELFSSLFASRFAELEKQTYFVAGGKL